MRRAESRIEARPDRRRPLRILDMYQFQKQVPSIPLFNRGHWITVSRMLPTSRIVAHVRQGLSFSLNWGVVYVRYFRISVTTYAETKAHPQ
jgi:hypothetical protein